MKRRFAIVIERTANDYCGHVPDLPVVAANGDTPEEVRQLLQEGAELYIDEMFAHRTPVPESATLVDYIDVEVERPGGVPGHDAEVAATQVGRRGRGDQRPSEPA